MITAELMGKLHRRPASSMNKNNITEGTPSTNQPSKCSDRDFSTTIARYNNDHKLMFIDLNLNDSIHLCVVTIYEAIFMPPKGVG